MSNDPNHVTSTPEEDNASNPQQPIPIPVDYLVHTDEHPFCDNPTCYCHEEQEEAIAEVHFYYQEGLLSADDATRIVQGKTL